MLRVEDVHVLRHKVLVEGLSRRQAAREMGISRNTVRRYLRLPEPVRVEREPRRKPVLERVQPRLDALLEEWSGRTTAKQRLTATRLHRQLREEGYEVGETLVRDYLREWRRRRAEVYVPLVHRPGDEAQVDFFEVTVEVGGERRKAWKFLMRLMYSGRDFVRLYDRQDQVAFLDGHVRAFAHFGGVPARIVYDNLAAAVRRVQFPRRQLTERFEALVSHYLYEPCFARPGEGHDKGGVEGRGRGVRLQHLTPIPRGDSLAGLSDWLQGEVDRHAAPRVWERFAEERPLLRPGPGVVFEARRVQPASVSRSALVRVEGAWYSVPSRWAGLRATALIGTDELTLRCRGEEVVHPRSPSAAAGWTTGTTSASWRASRRQCGRWRRSWSRRWASPSGGSGRGWSASRALRRGRAPWRGCCGPCTSTARSACATSWSRSSSRSASTSSPCSVCSPRPGRRRQ